MELSDFEIGMRVVARCAYGAVRRNDTGVVMAIKPDVGGIGVRWDRFDAYFHTLTGRCENKHGYWVGPEHIVPDYNDLVEMPDVQEDELLKILEVGHV